MHETPCPGRTSASRPKLKKKLVQRAEIEAKTCFAREITGKNPGELFKITVTVSKIPGIN